MRIDASANFPDFANSKENIARDLAIAKNTGFTDVVVDVRPTTGDVLFTTDVVDQVNYLGEHGHLTDIHASTELQPGTIFVHLLMKAIKLVSKYMQQ